MKAPYYPTEEELCTLSNRREHICIMTRPKMRWFRKNLQVAIQCKVCGKIDWVEVPTVIEETK
jgi:hypothetical protein